MDKNLINTLINAGLEFFKSKALPVIEKAAVKEVSKPVTPVQVTLTDTPADIDWSNPKSRINARFSVEEALLLPSWGVMHVPSEEEKQAIKEIAEGVLKAVEILEKEIGHPLKINVHAWMRPGVANIPGSKWNGQDYNRYIYESQVWVGLSDAEKSTKHVPNSPHKTGHAIDFHIVGYEGKDGCAKIRQMLIPHLEELGLRMEDIIGGWVHLDNLPVKVARFFKP